MSSQVVIPKQGQQRDQIKKQKQVKSQQITSPTVTTTSPTVTTQQTKSQQTQINPQPVATNPQPVATNPQPVVINQQAVAKNQLEKKNKMLPLSIYSSLAILSLIMIIFLSYSIATHDD
jgi:hypothetical protein